jgi:hypothetical protein
MASSQSYDHVNVTNDDIEFDSEVTALPLSDLELTSLSEWQREQVDGLSAEGQRCLYNSWFHTELPAGKNTFHL